MKRFKLEIEYDGTNYYGWQKQIDKPTIQGELEKTIMKMTGQKIVLHGSGRTDAGVHAKKQIAHFDCDTKIRDIDFLKGINSLSAEDIIIRKCSEVDEFFHSRFSAIKKTYQYTILNTKMPVAINRQYSWHIKEKLNITKMQEGADFLIGEYDFCAFEKKGTPLFHTTRKIITAKFNKKNNYIYFEITANGFLRYMVRNILGSLVELGKNKISLKDFYLILTSKDRNKNQACAPAHGLLLLSVEYSKKIPLNN